MHFRPRAAPEPETVSYRLRRKLQESRASATAQAGLECCFEKGLRIVATDKWANPQAMWDERYSEVEPVYGTKPNAYLEENSRRLKPGAKVFVPADGYGRNGLWLAKQGFQVHTADLSPVGV